MYSYVTVLTNDSYEPGVLGLWASLKKTKSVYPLLVLISGNVSQNVVQRISKLTHIKVMEDDIEIPDEISKRYNVEFFEKWNRTFFKLKVVSLTEFSKIVLLDADMIVMKNIDHLFDCEHMSCVYSEILRGGKVRLNSGMMVLEPSKDLYNTLVNSIIPTWQKIGNVAMGDQDVFKFVYPDWSQHKELILPIVYNCYNSDVDEFVKKRFFKYKDIYVVHYILTKPWTVKTSISYKQLVLYMLRKYQKRYFAITNIVFKKHYKRALKKCGIDG